MANAWIRKLKRNINPRNTIPKFTAITKSVIQTYDLLESCDLNKFQDSKKQESFKNQLTMLSNKINVILEQLNEV